MSELPAIADTRSPLPAYRIDGEGPWLTLLHGFSQDMQIWDGVVAEMQANFRLLRIDLRGHGGSSDLPGPYRPREYAADVLAVLDHLGVAATHIWGTHTGAGVALLLAAQHGLRVGGLILEGAVVPGEALEEVDSWHAASRTTLQREGIEDAVQAWWNDAPFFEHARRLARDAGRDDMRVAILRFSGAPWVAAPPPDSLPPAGDLCRAVRAPTLLLNGADDLPSFLAIARRLEREVRGARHTLLPDVGAFPGWEVPQIAAPLVAGFLDEVD